jgi:hypothetical protein
VCQVALESLHSKLARPTKPLAVHTQQVSALSGIVVYTDVFREGLDHPSEYVEMFVEFRAESVEQWAEMVHLAF